MKITFILASKALITGGYRAIFELSNHLVDRGHDVKLVYPFIPLEIETEFNMRRKISKLKTMLKNIIRGGGINWFDLKAKLVCIPSLSPGLSRYYDKWLPDSDIVIATAWETAFVVNKFSKRKGVKAYFVQHYEVWDIWNDDACWQEARKKAGNKSEIYMAMADLVPKDPGARKYKELVDGTYRLPFIKITTAHWLHDLIEKKFNANVEHITPGVNLDDFYPSAGKENRKKTILLSIRKAGWKGLRDGIEALIVVKDKFPDLTIIVYGEKHDEHVPDLLKAQNFQIVVGDELRKLYSSADIFVFASRVEGWGLPPMEAMACGTACVTTEVGGVLNYTKPGRTAMVVPPNNPEKLAGAIIDLLEDDYKRRSMSEAGLEYIRGFSWEDTTEQLEAVLEETVQVEMRQLVRKTDRVAHVETREIANAI